VAPSFLNLSINWKWVVTLTFRPLSSRGGGGARRNGVGRSRYVCLLSSFAEQTRLTCSSVADYDIDVPCSCVTCLYNGVKDSHPRPYTIQVSSPCCGRPLVPKQQADPRGFRCSFLCRPRQNPDCELRLKVS
jgi:hypothetical protein